MLARMKAFSRRPLSEGEIAIGASIFGDRIAWPRVRAAQLPKLGFGAMVPMGDTILFSHWHAAQDFAHASAPEQGWLVHELTHVWQAGSGVVLPVAKLSALGNAAYAYEAKAGAAFGDYNIEQQAEIARHLYLARVGAGVERAPSRAWLEGIWPL